MDALEQRNLARIESLKQRGGRTLSIVDLVAAGTITAEAAADVGDAIGRGASYLTAAIPGGAGKTALLAALLGFLPEGVPVDLVMSPDAISLADHELPPRCYVAHEIGQATIPGYLWGEHVSRYLALAQGPHMVVSCLHADTMEELQATLSSPPLCVPPVTLAAVQFALFLRVEAQGAEHRSVRRRVVAIHGGCGDGLRPVWEWDRDADALVRVRGDALTGRAHRLAALLSDLVERGIVEYGEVRRAIVMHRRADG